jgi:hypothetical protein
MEKENNIAFIDGQNLHIGIMQNNWKIDHSRFRIYIKKFASSLYKDLTIKYYDYLDNIDIRKKIEYTHK